MIWEAHVKMESEIECLMHGITSQNATYGSESLLQGRSPSLANALMQAKHEQSIESPP